MSNYRFKRFYEARWRIPHQCRLWSKHLLSALCLVLRHFTLLKKSIFMLVFSDADDMYWKRFFNDCLFTDP